MPFDFTNSSDRSFFESVVNEAIKVFGLNIIYYTTTFNQNKEPIYGEDSKPLISGEYKIKAYSESIQEDWILTRFGLGSNDLMVIHIDVKEFEFAVGDFEPKPGDYVWVDYMSRLFIVTDVDKEDNIFLQKKFVYNIKMKSADISGEEIGVGLTTITNYETISDNQNDNTAISQAASAVVKTKLNDSSIFGAFE